MSTCATQGVFSNAIYTVYDSKNDRCNTYFDCNNSDSYYQSYKIGSGPSTSYPQYDFPQVAQSDTTTAQYRFETCSTSCPAIDPKVFPPTPDICACPDGLNITTDGTKGDDGSITYDSNVCFKNGTDGKINHETTKIPPIPFGCFLGPTGSNQCYFCANNEDCPCQSGYDQDGNIVPSAIPVCRPEVSNQNNRCTLYGQSCDVCVSPAKQCD
jgi:hypothetical protein